MNQDTFESITQFIAPFIRDAAEQIGEKQPKQLLRRLLDYCDNPCEQGEYLRKYALLKTVSFIYTSNDLEQTIPSRASQHETYKLLENILNSSSSEPTEPSQWKVDGDEGTKKADKFQMIQHVRAHEYLCSEENLTQPLTAEIIQTTHGILLKGAIDEDSVLVPSGKYREIQVFAGDHVYPCHEDIEESMDKIIYDFNNSKDHYIMRAAHLFYEVITIHPFVNGNGRLCRLLLAYALRKSGIPFSVSLSSGSNQSRVHYICAIQNIRYLDNYSLLGQLIIWSIYMAKKSYEVNLTIKQKLRASDSQKSNGNELTTITSSK